MVKAMEAEGSDDPSQRITLKMASDVIANMPFADFVTSVFRPHQVPPDHGHQH
jgi:hypothetical protein